jgi:hypothetical protein
VLIKELVTRLGFDVDFTALNKFDSKIGETEDGLKGLGSEADSSANKVKNALLTVRNAVLGIAAVTAAGATGLVAMVKSAANAGEEIERTAPMLGLSIEEFQKYRYAAKVAGVENENFAGTVQLLLRNVSEAQKGNAEIGKSFARLGISVESLRGQSTDQVLRRISDGLTKIPNQADRIALSMELMGRSGARMGAFLAKGTGEMDSLMADAEAFGMFTAESAKNADDMNDAWDRVAFFIAGIKNELIALAPIFTEILDDMRKWLSQHREAIKSGLTKAIWLIGRAIVFLWGVTKRIIKAFEFMIKILGGLQNAFRLLGLFLVSSLMVVLGPISLVVAAIGVLLVVFLKIKSAIGKFAFAIGVATPILTALAYALGIISTTKILAWITPLISGFKALSASVLVPALSFLALAAALVAVFLIFEDITTWIMGNGKSVIGEWLGPWSEVPDKLQKIWDKIKAVFVSGGKFIAAVFRGDFKEAYKILEDGAGKVKDAITDKSGLKPESAGDRYMRYTTLMGAPGLVGNSTFAGAEGGMTIREMSEKEKSRFSTRKFTDQYALGAGAKAVGQGASSAASGPRIGKVEMNIALAQGTSNEQAEEIAQIVDKRLSQHIDHSLQQSSGPGD